MTERADVARGGMDRPAYFGGEAQPVPDASLPQAVPLAWKTGTSYGYRDAWAVGLNARYLIGIWTGRPDAGGGPVWLRQRRTAAQGVNNLLLARPAMSAAGCRRSAPGNGQPGNLPAGDSNCRRRTASWLWMPASRRLCCCRGRRAYADPLPGVAQ